MEGFGEFIGWLIAAALTVLLVVFLADKIGIWDICAIWDTSCNEVTGQPKDGPKPIAGQSVPPDSVQPKQEKQEPGSGLPKALIPQLTIGPWTINKKPEPEPGGDISSDFIGRWSGTVVKKGNYKDQYPVVVTIYEGKKTERVGSINYDTLKCGGHLFLYLTYPKRIFVEERLTKGLLRCIDRSIITLTNNKDGTLDYNVLVEDTAGMAVLKKSP